jgi:tRNA modification GTPase
VASFLEQAGDQDTICALSTPPGVGGIAVVRVSGPRSALITRKLCSFLPADPESHRIYYGILRSNIDQKPPIPGADSVDPGIDEVLVSYFKDGRSFTGEETCEISCHGGAVLQSTILKELILPRLHEWSA